MEKINAFINKKIILIITIFLFIQPILDMLTGILIYCFKSSLTIGAIVRILFLAFTIYYLLFIDNKYKKYLYVLFTYSLIFVIVNMISKPDMNIVLEIKYLLNNIYLPIMLVFFLTVLKEKEINMKHLYIIFCIYILLIFIPNILNIGFDSYAYSKKGSIGFFYSANAIGNIISIIFPMFMANIIKNKKHLILFLIIYMYILFTIGTKAPILCFLIVLFYYVLLSFMKMIKAKKYKSIIVSSIILVALITICIIVMPHSPFYKNLVIHLNYLHVKTFKDLLTYKNIDHFVFSSRLTFFKTGLRAYNHSNIFQKVFGIGYITNTNKIMLIAEMDYLDTFIHQGIIGFVIIYYIYFKVIFEIFKSWFKDIKTNFFDVQKTSKIISSVILLLCSSVIGHVLGTPSVSIFVALLLVIDYNYICERKEV